MSMIYQCFFYLLLKALVDVETAVGDLLVARRTHAPIASLRVDALVLAPMLPGRALVHVAARPAVRIEDVAWRALALVAAERVVTLVFTRIRHLNSPRRQRFKNYSSSY